MLVGKSRTDWFQVNLGLRQGCILSPLLFNLFINDLREEVHKLGKGVMCGNIKVSFVYFADDIVLLAKCKKDLEYMLNSMYNYSLQWRIKFNYDKCNIVVFDNVNRKSITVGNCSGTCTCNHHCQFGPNLIKESIIYKYLGVELNNKLSYNTFKQRILAKARTNMNRLCYMGIKATYL